MIDRWADGVFTIVTNIKISVSFIAPIIQHTSQCVPGAGEQVHLAQDVGQLQARALTALPDGLPDAQESLGQGDGDGDGVSGILNHIPEY